MTDTFDPNTYTAQDTFGELAAAYGDAFDRVPAQVRSVEWVTGQLTRDAKVLDVGCGTGRPACEILVNAGLDVTGIDITPGMIEVAKSKVPGARYGVADSRKWEPSEGEASFDAVVSFFAFIAAVSQEDIRTFFKRAYTWLRPGGVFVFGTVPVEGDNIAIRWLGRDIVVSSLNHEDSVDAIEAAGFLIEKHFTEKYTPKAAEVGICKPEEVWEEEQLFVYARKPKQ